jgi:hypothetical protein
MAGEVRIQTFVQLIKFGGYRQFSVPKPPLLLAANVTHKLKTSRTNSTFNFSHRKKPTLKKIKELFFANASQYCI